MTASISENPFPALRGISEIASLYDAVLCDVWGVIHNGQVPHEAALGALIRVRAAEKPVVLLSNAPRPAPPVMNQLKGFGAEIGVHYDALVTAGDIARHVVIQEFPHKVAYHIGLERDTPIFFNLPVERTDDLGAADFILCTGFRDEGHETVEDYRELFEQAIAQGVTLVCANPDLVVHVGADMFLCAGALAAFYEELGGRMINCGKPFRSAYDTTLDVIAACAGKVIPAGRVLAIGDGLDTDIRGAVDSGLPSLLITSGIHRDEHAGDPLRLAELADKRGLRPDWVLNHLAW